MPISRRRWIAGDGSSRRALCRASMVSAVGATQALVPGNQGHPGEARSTDGWFPVNNRRSRVRKLVSSPVCSSIQAMPRR